MKLTPSPRACLCASCPIRKDQGRIHKNVEASQSQRGLYRAVSRTHFAGISSYSITEEHTEEMYVVEKDKGED